MAAEERLILILPGFFPFPLIGTSGDIDQLNPLQIRQFWFTTFDLLDLLPKTLNPVGPKNRGAYRLMDRFSKSEIQVKKFLEKK
jgi:hypothetical protein